MLKLPDETKITITELPDQSLVHKLEEKEMSSTKRIGLITVIIAAGIFSGYVLSVNLAKPRLPLSSSSKSEGPAKVVVGSKDVKTFRDSAEGELAAGGINGEGTHRLIRPGGEQQTVYLTSSVLDLNQFVNKKVRVWGETFAAKKAGWLMDVGKIEVLE